MDAEEALGAIRRDLDALVLTLRNYIAVQTVTDQKIDLILKVLDRPTPESDPVADALTEMAAAIRDVAEGQERMLAMQDALLRRLGSGDGSARPC